MAVLNDSESQIVPLSNQNGPTNKNT